MHNLNKVGSFMTLRANGWSLDKIAKQINVSKTTLWSWDVKHEAEIHLLKHMQLERVQEQYLPSYEEELKNLSGQLGRIEQALDHQDLAKLGPAFLLQMSLQIRDRLSKMRQQAPLRTVPYGPIQPLPVTGCVTKDEQYPWIHGDPAVEAVEEAELAAEAAPANAPDSAPAPTPQSAASAPVAEALPGSALQQPASGNGKPHLNGHSHNGNGKHNGYVNGTVHVNGKHPTPSPMSSPVCGDASRNPKPPVVMNLETEQNRTKGQGGLNSDPSPSTTSKPEN